MLALLACGASPETRTTPPGISEAAPKPARATADLIEAEQITTVPIGTALSVRLDEPISSLDSEEGDRVTGRVVDEVVAPNGVVAIPAGTHVIGHITSLRGADEPGGAAVSLRFDTALIDGSPLALDATHAERIQLGANESMPAGSSLTVRLNRALQVDAVEPGKGGGYHVPGPSLDPDEDPYIRGPIPRE